MRLMDRPYSYRREKWANASYFALLIGQIVSGLIPSSHRFVWLWCVSFGLASVALASGLFLASLSGWTTPRGTFRGYVWVWGFFLGTTIVRWFFACFLPWATTSPVLGVF